MRMKFHHRGVALVTAAALLAPSAVLPASQRIRSKTHAGVAKLRIGKKLSTYYKTTREKPLEFKFQGPESLRILSRFFFPGEAPEGEVTYELSMEIDGVPVRRIMETAQLTDSAHLTDGGRVGTPERAVAQIPAGKHRITIRPVEQGVTVGLRVFRGLRRQAKLKWISFAPQIFERAVRLHASDVELTYYRLDKEHPVELEILGPLRLQIRSRLDFGPESGYTQSYVLQVHLDGEPWKSFRLESRASHTSTYPDLEEITPGRGRTVEVAVPEGEHRVTIHLNSTTAQGCSVRILAPEKDLTRPAG